MWQAFRSVTLASPLIFFHWGSYNNNIPATFQYRLICIQQTQIKIQAYKISYIPERT
jgi:hypothetical protein